jgi:hypothetical protein
MPSNVICILGVLCFIVLAFLEEVLDCTNKCLVIKIISEQVRTEICMHYSTGPTISIVLFFLNHLINHLYRSNIYILYEIHFLIRSMLKVQLYFFRLCIAFFLMTIVKPNSLFILIYSIYASNFRSNARGII